MNANDPSSTRLTPADADREAVAHRDDAHAIGERDGTDGACAHADAGEVHDLSVRFRRGLLGFMTVGGVAGGVSGFTVAVLGWPQFAIALLVILLMAAILTALGSFQSARLRRALERLTHDAGSDHEDLSALTDVLDRIAGEKARLMNTLRPKRSATREIGTTLIALRGPGRAYRILSPDVDAPVWDPPLDTPIEPIPLSLRSPAFLALIGEEKARRPGWRQVLDQAAETYGTSRWTRIFVLACMVIGFGVLALELVRGVIFVIQGQVPPVLLYVAAPFPPLIVWWAWQRWSLESWLLVPGALIVRTALWSSPNWTLHRFPRTESVLVYWRELKMLVIADTDGNAFSRVISRREAEMAFRAWLSPLPPPQREQLTDLETE